jgi:hypothetical protein
MAEAAVAIRPPTFSGKANEDADSFLNAFERYIRYREIKDADKKLNLLAVLLTDAAGDWFESLPDSSKTSYDNLRAAFASRYQSTDTIKFKCAAEIFTRKQGETQSVDDYVTQMCKLAKLCSADENILKFAIINGLKPYISVQVTQAKPATIDKILEVARLAELAMPRAAVANPDSAISQQLAEMQTEMRRLMTKVDKAMVSNVRSRTPTPERRVHFEQAEPRGPSSAPVKNVFVDRRIDSGPVNNYRTRQSMTPRSSYNQQRQQPVNYRTQRQPLQRPTEPCTRCARLHNKQAFCPARDPTKVCNFCGKPGHFQAACFSANSQF